MLKFMRKSIKIKRLDLRGDTIVEVLIAISIAAFAIGISYATASRSLRQAITAREHNQALNIIENQIADLKLRFQNTPVADFDNQFGSTGGKQDFCLDDSSTGPNDARYQWTPYNNYKGVSESSALSSSTSPNQSHPYYYNPSSKTGCQQQKPSDGATYYINIHTIRLTGVSSHPTIYWIIVRWEPIGGGQTNQASIYYRLNGSQGQSLAAITPPSGPPPNTVNIQLDVVVLGHPLLPLSPVMTVTVDGVTRFGPHYYTINELPTICPNHHYSTPLPYYGSNYDTEERCQAVPPITLGNVPTPKRITVTFGNDATGWNSTRAGCPPKQPSPNDDACWEDNNIIIKSLKVPGYKVVFDNYDNGDYLGSSVPEPPQGAALPPYSLWMPWSGSAVFDVVKA